MEGRKEIENKNRYVFFRGWFERLDPSLGKLITFVLFKEIYLQVLKESKNDMEKIKLEFYKWHLYNKKKVKMMSTSHCFAWNLLCNYQ
jgi:hypothetical protein